jgi:hypothetical protein
LNEKKSFNSLLLNILPEETAQSSKKMESFGKKYELLTVLLLILKVLLIIHENLPRKLEA